MKKKKIKFILGIETSCDDTSVSIVDNDRNILSNIVINQNSKHRKYGGIVPEIAARAHTDNIDNALKQSLLKAKISLNEVDLICSTAGPGLIGGLIVGTTFSKTLSCILKKPFVAVNHLEGHALTARLVYGIKYPYLLLLASGGHTQLILVKKYGIYKRISTTLDDAAGETFDKAAKLLKLPPPGGVEIEKLSLIGNNKAFRLPRPLYKSNNPNFSFSGLKTAFSRLVNMTNIEKNKNDLAATLQSAIVDCIIDRTRLAIDNLENNLNITRLVAAGGVISNIFLRKKLMELAKIKNLKFYAPPINLCTDNGAMIAWSGYEKFKNFGSSSLDFKPRPRWPLDPDSYLNHPTMKKIGKKGIKA